MPERSDADVRRALVTGAAGFVGRALCRRLLADGWQVRGVVRAAGGNDPAGIEIVSVGDLQDFGNWSPVLDGIDAIVHLAARVHVTRETNADPLAQFRCINVQATERLAEAAAAAGVRRMVFLSTVKVHGEESSRPLKEDSPATPLDFYGLSKWEAELALRKIAGKTGLDVVILRPPLVYGPGVRANFLSLLNAVARGFPLPFAAVENRRSMIYLENLVDAIRLVLDRPAARGQTFLVADGHDISTAVLIRQIAAAMGRTPRLWPISLKWLNRLGQWSGRADAVTKVTGSLIVDAGKIRESLSWDPPYSFEEGIRETVASHQTKASRKPGIMNKHA